MFDKKKYAARRKKGLRGVEDLRSKPKVALFTEEDYKKGLCGKKQIGKERTSGVTMHMTKKGLIAVTRKMNRNRAIDRTQTHRGFVYGTKIGSKAHGILESAKRKFAKEHKGERIPSAELERHREKNPLSHDPNATNKQRFTLRKMMRDAARSSKTT